MHKDSQDQSEHTGNPMQNHMGHNRWTAMVTILPNKQGGQSKYRIASIGRRVDGSSKNIEKGCKDDVETKAISVAKGKVSILQSTLHFSWIMPP